MTKASGEIHIGTSGWSYDHWKGNFYPEDLPKSRWLEYYVGRMHTVEINSSFYHLPKAETFDSWRDMASEGFVFAVKASRFITHMKKLKDPEEPVSTFLSRAGHLGGKLGPILFQLPPGWNFNEGRLAHFLEALPGGYDYAMEFRDETWWNDRVYALLNRHHAAFCMFELAGRLSPGEVTADFVYIRLHGPGSAYAGKYDEASLSGWAEKIKMWAGEGATVYCYFDNDQHGYAAANALELTQLLA